MDDPLTVDETLLLNLESHNQLGLLGKGVDVIGGVCLDGEVDVGYCGGNHDEQERGC